MAHPRNIPPCGLPVLALLYAPGAPVEALVKSWSARLEISPVLGPDIPFTFTSYYHTEMGPGLRKRWMVFPVPRPFPELVIWKGWAYQDEQHHLHRQRRTLNVDPGWLGLSHLVLASFKPFAHRLYLGEGVYAEVTLIYRSKPPRWETLPWTYADYRDPRVQRFLLDLRRQWGTHLRGTETTSP